MSATVNGFDALTLKIRKIRTGPAHIDAELDGEVTLTNPVTIDIDGVQFIGAAMEQGSHSGRTQAWIVGGAGGLSKELPVQHYVEPNAVTIIRDILNAAGEKLDAAHAIPNRTLPSWERAKSLASHALVAICDKLGLVWRTTDTGTIWVGVDTFQKVSPKVENLWEDWSEGAIHLAADEFSELWKVAPGATLFGHKLDEVTHTVKPSSTRTVARTESVETAAKAFLSTIRSAMAYAGVYRAIVVAQNGDGTLQLQPDDDRIAGAGLDKVPMRHGLPGWVAKVQPGAVVRVGFEGNDPSIPYASLWDEGQGSKVTSVEYKPGGVSAPVCRIGDIVGIQLPISLPIAGTLDGVEFVGTIIVTTELQGVIQGPGNPKLLL